MARKFADRVLLVYDNIRAALVKPANRTCILSLYKVYYNWGGKWA